MRSASRKFIKTQEFSDLLTISRRFYFNFLSDAIATRLPASQNKSSRKFDSLFLFLFDCYFSWLTNQFEPFLWFLAVKEKTLENQTWKVIGGNWGKTGKLILPWNSLLIWSFTDFYWDHEEFSWFFHSFDRIFCFKFVCFFKKDCSPMMCWLFSYFLVFLLVVTHGSSNRYQSDFVMLNNFWKNVAKLVLNFFHNVFVTPLIKHPQCMILIKYLAASFIKFELSKVGN